MKAAMRQRQLGITVVEFAIIGVLLYLLLFGVVEFGRLLFTFVALGESTRRAARLATVCPINDPGITSTGLFANLPGFNSANLQIQYLTANGTVLTNPGGSYGNIQYVRVRVTGYSISLAIPLINPTITAPAFAVTLPREALGVTRTTTYTCS
jgi:Flp pilus assembly protein TadG